MSSHDDDEFKDVIKGLPSNDTAQKSSIKFASIFLVGAVIITVLIILFGEEYMDMFDADNSIPPQIIMNGSISLLIASLQAWIFKSKLKSRIAFVAFALLGGVIGGIAGGYFINRDFLIGNDTMRSLTVGAINGALAGGLSSLAQNKVMGNRENGIRWFLYNLISWTVIDMIAWRIAWIPNIQTLALAGGFILAVSGMGLVIFLRKTPQIEFS